MLGEHIGVKGHRGDCHQCMVYGKGSGVGCVRSRGCAGKGVYSCAGGGGKSARQGRKAGRERSFSNTAKVGIDIAQVSGELAGGVALA